ncbi:MAG: bifunctional metallophosphatase/5'-nucleotidase [Bacillota bacterium]
MKNRKFLVWTVVVALLLTMSMSALVRAEDNTVAPTAKTITIFHTNDTHSRVVEGSDSIGFAKLASLINAYRSEHPNTLVLDAGDTFHGQTISTLVKGASIVEVMNAIGYDAMTPGNHDFNYGYEQLLELAKQATFPILSANVKKEDGSNLMTPYVIKEVDGIRVGIFGLSTPETTFKTNPLNVKGLTFADPVAEAKLMVAQLQGQVDVMIALAHIGLDTTSEVTSAMIAKAVPEIDVIIDGHSHTVLKNGQLEGQTLIASTGQYDGNLGVVDLTFEGGKLVNKQAKLIAKAETKDAVANENVTKIVSAITDAQKPILDQVIGSTPIKLEGTREVVRKGESNMGNLITDAMISITGADLAITNGGGIRASIEQGEITKGEVITVLPFGNYIVTKKVKGSDIKAALEMGTKGYPGLVGAFPHVSGMTYTIDTTRPAGNHIVSAMVKGQPLAMDREYLVATNDFMAIGGDGYTMFASYPIANEFPALDEALISHLQTQKPIPVVEGRVMVLGNDHWANYLAIQMINAGILEAPVAADGVNHNGQINLDEQITVAEFTSLLAKALKTPVAVPANALATITRERAIQMVMNDYLKQSGSSVIPSTFTDAAAVSADCAATMANAIKIGLVHGYNGQLTPQASLSRADALALVNKMLAIKALQPAA